MQPQLAAGFWSYAHLDDDREAGRVTRLAELIKAEFEILTASTLQIFVDRDGIRWGDRMRQEIDDALQRTTFFIPILTPTYFERDECRKEMLRFVNSARALGLEELLMSIRYVPVEDLREDSPDELKAIAAGMQYEDWSELRFSGLKSARHRSAVNRLARRLVDLSRQLEERPTSGQAGGAGGGAQKTATGRPTAPQSPPPSDEQVPGDDEPDAPGILDLLGDLQPRLEAWNGTVARLAEPSATFGDLMQAGAERMNQTGSQPNAFARRVVISRELAAQLDPVVRELEELSKEYSARLVDIDPSVHAFIEAAVWARENDEEANSAAALTAVRELVDSSRAASSSIAGAADAARSVSGMSRDLRPIFRRYEVALRNIVDGQSIIDGWESEIERRGAAARAE